MELYKGINYDLYREGQRPVFCPFAPSSLDGLPSRICGDWCSLFVHNFEEDAKDGDEGVVSIECGSVKRNRKVTLVKPAINIIEDDTY